MPISTAAKLALAAATLGGLAWYGRSQKGRKILRGEGVPACLEGVWASRQALIPDIYNNVRQTAQATADQFFGVHLTQSAQGQLFEALAEIFVDTPESTTADAALMALSQVAPCDWSAEEWSLPMAEVFGSTEALALVVLADINDVVMSYELPPIRVIVDAEADKCVADVYELQPQALHPEILPELGPAATAVAQGESFHLGHDAQGRAFLHLAHMAANEVGMWLTTPILDTLQAIAPGCAWDRKDRYTQRMVDVWEDVAKFQEIVETDIGIGGASPSG